MKIFNLYLIVFVGLLGSMGMMKRAADNPEKLLIGSWQEMYWDFERIDFKPKYEENHENLCQYVKNTMGQHLVIHTKENWHFLPDGTVLLEGECSTTKARWCIKGRGHILQLKYADDAVENYNISELTKTHITLNFDSEVQARGIAKLVFEKT